jgi:hypothetical protein
MPSKDKPSPADPKDAAKSASRRGNESSGSGRSSPSRSGGQGQQGGENLSAKGGRESHKNDPFPPPKDAIDKTSPSDPTDAARKGGQHSHTGGGNR